jgi:hypothetical protein
MSELIALRAMFGQDEVSHGMTRYRVAVDHSVYVPREVALYLVNSGGFAVESRTKVGEPPDSNSGQGLVRVRHTIRIPIEDP